MGLLIDAHLGTANTSLNLDEGARSVSTAQNLRCFYQLVSVYASNELNCNHFDFGEIFVTIPPS